jgi:hypothetical protein
MLWIKIRGVGGEVYVSEGKRARFFDFLVFKTLKVKGAPFTKNASQIEWG